MSDQPDLRQTFRALGVDIDDQDSLNAFRADLVYARRQRRLSERAKLIALRTVVTAVVTGAVGGAGLAIKWLWSLIHVGN